MAIDYCQLRSCRKGISSHFSSPFNLLSIQLLFKPFTNAHSIKMSARRQSARLTGSQASSQELPSPTRKRKASVSESSPQSKGSSKPKQQKTLEQTIPDADQGVADADMKDAATEVEDKQANGAEEDKKGMSHCDRLLCGHADDRAF